MGLNDVMAEIIFSEHIFRPITGKILTVGRAAILISPQEIHDRLLARGITPRIAVQDFAMDNENIHGQGQPLPLDKSFFGSFSKASVHAIDISDYEGADIVHDLNESIPDSLCEQFDFIIDGSTIDNVFDPVMLMKNVTRLLKPGGRAVIYGATNSTPPAYIQIQPDWLLDYCLINNFEYAKVYVFDGEQRECWEYEPSGVYNGMLGFLPSHITALVHGQDYKRGSQK